MIIGASSISAWTPAQLSPTAWFDASYKTTSAAQAGDFARKINYTYSGTSEIFEIPYTLTSTDLVVP